METETVKLETEKITELELTKLAEIQEKTRNLAFELGEIELIKIQLEDRHKAAVSLLNEVKSTELEFSSEIIEKYGKINLNPQTGEYSKIG